MSSALLSYAQKTIFLYKTYISTATLSVHTTYLFTRLQCLNKQLQHQLHFLLKLDLVSNFSMLLLQIVKSDHSVKQQLGKRGKCYCSNTWKICPTISHRFEKHWIRYLTPVDTLTVCRALELVSLKSGGWLVYWFLQDTFFYSLVYDPTQKTLLADKGEIRVGPRFQADVPEMLQEGQWELYMIHSPWFF